jgi:peptide/nickel transport system permease protein
MGEAPLLSIAPGLMIALCLLGANLLGDALRDLLDPRDGG